MNRMNDELRRDSRKDPEQLEREIDATRAELRATLEELEHRLSPGEILDTVMSRVRRDGGQFAGNLGTSLRDNPMPALLTSIGIAWMMASNGRHHNGETRHVRGSRIRESAGRMRERWQGTREAVRHRGEAAREGVAGTRAAVSGSAEKVRRRARGMSSAARRGAARTRSSVDYLWHEQPLILGAIGLAAGAIAGAALPPTEQEDEAFGAMRDRALDRAKTAGTEGAKQARERVEKAAQQATEAVREGEGEQRSPEQNRDQRVEPNAPESPTTTSSPGTGLGY